MTPDEKNLRNWISLKTWQQFQEEKTTAHRVFSSEKGWIERWNEELVISYYDPKFRDTIIPALQNWSQQINFNYLRLWEKLLVKEEAKKNSPKLIKGNLPNSFLFPVLERGVSFQIDFQSGYSLGLFLDQRHNRDFVKRQKPKKLLNCFAYTGSFSVMAALKGGETLSLDLSKKTLERAKENFRLNQLDPTFHRFWAEDVRLALPKLKRRQEFFDIIILDPPTFSKRKKGKPFQVEHDLKSLILEALPLLSPQGKLLVSTNCNRISEDNLNQLCRSALGSQLAQFHSETTLPDIPKKFAAKTIWLLLK